MNTKVGLAVCIAAQLLQGCSGDEGNLNANELSTIGRDLASAGHSSRAITITRDEHGVPHVFGRSAADLYYGAGYVAGQDRLWQAEVYYRTAVGRMAELLGPDSLESDQSARLLFGSPARIRAALAAAPADVRVILDAYVAGLNTWVKEAAGSGQLPFEYAAFGLEPHTWVAEDALATYIFFTAFNGSFGADELDNAQFGAELVQRLGAEQAAAVFSDSHYLDDPAARTTVPGRHFSALPSVHRSSSLPPGSLHAAAVRDPRRAWARQLGADPTAAASNAIVLAPALTAHGRPLLLGGPQVGFSTPQVFHEVGLHGAGMDVTGISIAGHPLVLIGVTPDFAWTITTGGTDTQDIFAEQLIPEHPGQYLYQSTLQDLDCRTESFEVAGLPSAVEQTLCESVHGPVVGVRDATAFTLMDAARGAEVRSFQATAQLASAHSLAEVRSIVANGAYNYNLLYADVRGNIAYWHLGQVPVRAPGANPFLPQPGDGSSEWTGFVPFREMPQVINPRQGYLVSWNNKPSPGWPTSTGGFWAWGGVHRVNHLLNRVAGIAPRSATMQTLEAINRDAATTVDTPSGYAFGVFAPTLLPPLLAHVDATLDARLPGVVALLRGWELKQIDADGDGRYDHPGVALFNAFWQQLVARIFLDDVGPNLHTTLVANLLQRLLDGSAASLPLLGDYLEGESLETAVTTSLLAALDELTLKYGPEPELWLQPSAQIDWEPLGAVAAPSTPWANRGTYNQIVELRPGRNRAENVVAPGQSGNPNDPHFADQLELFATLRYKPMRLGISEILDAAQTSQTLRRSR